MRKAFLLLTLAANLTISGQENWGRIVFSNRKIPTSDGIATYNVPMYSRPSGSQGAGTLPGGVTVGLYLPGGDLASPLASTKLRTDSFSMFFASSEQMVAIPGVQPGARTMLRVVAWQGESYEEAIWSGGLVDEWSFESLPLGSADGSIPTPGMTGWGTEDGRGVSLGPLSLIPWTGIRFPKGGSVFAAPETIDIVGSAITYPYDWRFPPVITNFTVYANSNLISDTIPSSGKFNVRTASLPAGTYTLQSTMAYHFVDSSNNRVWPGDTTTSQPVVITVVDPVELRMNNHAIANGQFSFNYSVNPGLRYIVQSSVDLRNWEPVTTNMPVTNPALFTQAIESSSKYFRVDRLPNQ
jgi:hypothetical protein